MRSWSWPSLEGTDGDDFERDEMLRRFVEASRRAEILAMVNSAVTEAEVGEAVTGELCEAFEAEVAFLVVQRSDDAPPELVGSSGLIGEQGRALLHDPLVMSGLRGEVPDGLDGFDALDIGLRWLAVEPFAAESGGRAVVGVGRLYDQPFDPPEIALLRAVSESAGHALERFWLAAERARSAAGQAALARAARSLGASLEREHVLDVLCAEVAGAMGADIVNVYFGDASSGLVAVASHGAGADFTGFRREPGEGLCGQAVRTGRPQISNAYVADGYVPTATAALSALEAAVAVPLHRHETTDGAMSVGWHSPRWIERSDVELAEAFAELASIACRNAEVHADARRAAMVDGLTGCLNHGAFQTLLREEIAREERAAQRTGLSLVLIDLFDFKSVNEDHGHPAGDELLRTVGDLLRGAVRPYDQVARYGGDEFALLLPNTDHEAARPVAQRAVAALSSARRPDGGELRASHGVVEWQPGELATDLLDRVDRLLHSSKVELHGTPPAPAPREGTGRRVADRRARRLALAGAVGSRLARQLDVTAIAETVVTELQSAVGGDACRLVRLHEDGYVSAIAASGAAASARMVWTQPQDEGAIGRCLRERRPVLRSTGLEEDGTLGFELAVPVLSGGQLWGALHVRAVGEEALTGEDVDFAELVSEHLGAALHTADLYRRLDQAYLGTAEALAAALEAKDDYTADHARSIADLAVAVGRELDLDDAHLRDLRYGAIFHDIGKIAIPDAILNKPAPLNHEERRVIETHPLAGEQILAPVPFLSRVRRIVRHDHERWDGTGYPDGLRGPQIPIGARIVFAVDSFHAMVSDRPYRKGMPEAEARAEMRANAGTQFDPAVVEAFLRVLDEVGLGALFGRPSGP
jgi:diguanylate cyclase (GGDEF)-like protein